MFNCHLVASCDRPEEGYATEPVPDEPTTYTEGDIFQYKCLYDLVVYFPSTDRGKLDATCGGDGKWSIQSPICTGILNLNKFTKTSDWLKSYY